MMIAAAALVLTPAARGEGIDPLRCEAIGMRKEGQWYECLGRCERRNGRRLDRLDTEADARLAECRRGCELRFNAAMDQLEQRDICSTAAPQPDANRCQARLLRVGANRLFCKAHCDDPAAAHPAGDRAGCEQQCDARCASATERLLAKEICQGTTGSDLCSEHRVAQ
jgi:hypothetical protein